MKKCYKCNVQFDNDAARFCPYCGSPLAIDKEWQAEQDRKARQASEAQARADAWNAKSGPVLKRWRDIYSQYSRLRHDSTFPFYLLQFREPWNVRTDTELEALTWQAEFMEEYMAAVSNSGGSDMVQRFKKRCLSELETLNKHISKLQSYSPSSGSGLAIILDFAKKVRDGGRVQFKRDLQNWVSEEQKPGDKYGGSNWFECSFKDIPYADMQKYNITGYHKGGDYRDTYEIKYYRCRLYREESWRLVTIDLGYSSMQSRINGVSNYASDWGKKLLGCYSDLKFVNDWLSKHTDSYGGKSVGPDTAADQIIGLKLSNAKTDSRYEHSSKTACGYKYMQQDRLVKRGDRY